MSWLPLPGYPLWGTSSVSGDPMKWLPPSKWIPPPATTTPAPRSSLNQTASPASERQSTIAADNAPIRITYGRDRIGAQIANVLLHGGFWVVQCVWGEGPIDSIESITFSDEPVPAGVQVQHYTGTAGQTVNAWLVDAFAAKGVTYADALPGIAYSVLRIPTGVETGWDSITATIKGRSLFDSRTDATAYSNNPALALADFLTNTIYGCGWTVDWDSVAVAADACDEVVGGKPRRTLGLTIESIATVDSWVDTLRTYAGCLRPLIGPNGWKLVPDAITAATKHFDHAAGNILSISPVKKRGRRDTPTLIRLTWTDTTQSPWRDVPVVVSLPGVMEGTTARRESDIPLPGIHDASQATREAIERLNKLTLNDIAFELEVFDEGLSVEPGDVVTVTHPVGLSAKPMRVLGVSGEHGRYKLSLVEYDPAMYSDVVVDEPTFADTDLPLPTAPIPATNLVLTEEVFAQQNGTYSSRIAVTWDAPDYPFVSAYRVNVIAGGSLVFTGTASTPVFRSPAIQEGVMYQVDVITVSTFGATSAALSAAIVAQGKNLPPGNVAELRGFEVGGEVRLDWDAAIDIDIWRYEVRYGLVGADWDDGIVIDRIDSLRLNSRVVPVGTWDLMVKAIDSVGHYSPVEARRSITVTLDDNAFLADVATYDTPTLTAMHEYRLGRIDPVRRFVTTSANAWNTTFSSAMNTYANPALSYFPATSQFLTESHDFGLPLSGNWRSELSLTDIAGTASNQMEISPDNVLWDDYPSLTAKTGGRFARIRANTTGVMAITLPTAQTRIDAVPRSENGSDTSAASGPKTITLANDYAAVKAINLLALGVNPRTSSVDNIVVGNPTTFDVYIFDAAGTQVANAFQWAFDGV